MALTPHPFADLLRTGQIALALERAQVWLPKASYADISRLTDHCPASLQQHLVVLFRDVLTGWPNSLYGIPCVFRYEPDRQRDTDLILPLPDSPPNDFVTSVSWMPLSIWRDTAPFWPRPGPVSIQAGTQSGAVLLVRGKCSDVALEPPDDEWWGEAFRLLPDGDRIEMSSRGCMPITDALEYGLRMLNSALGSHNVETPRRFISELEYQAAAEAGRQFRGMLQSR